MLIILFSCQKKRQSNVQADSTKVNTSINHDYLENSENSTHDKFDAISCDLDGDKKTDIVRLTIGPINKKSGLEITFGNGQVSKLGFGEQVLDQGFDNFDWVGIFEKVQKGQLTWCNVNQDGEILPEDKIAEHDKILLPNDGIFVHQDESCGGGIIYFDKSKFNWIQRE